MPIPSSVNAAQPEAPYPPIICPHCRARNPEVKVYQYTWNRQDCAFSEESGEHDDWSTSAYNYEGDQCVGAECIECDGDLVPYLMRREGRTGKNITRFVHDVIIENRMHERPKKYPHGKGNGRGVSGLWRATQPDDATLREQVRQTIELLGVLLDEEARRKEARDKVAAYQAKEARRAEA